jgi:hypothetical protein
MFYKDIFIDGKKVTKLLNRKDTYTWLLMEDNSVKRVLTVDYDSVRERPWNTVLVSR